MEKNEKNVEKRSGFYRIRGKNILLGRFQIKIREHSNILNEDDFLSFNRPIRNFLLVKKE